MRIGFADALQRVFLTTVASYLQFRGWICPETLCDRSSVTFDLRQQAPARLIVVNHPGYETYFNAYAPTRG